MGIGGINNYSGMLKNYSVSVIPSVSIDEVHKQDEANAKKSAELQQPSHELPIAEVPVLKRKDSKLQDISITFNKSDDFGYIGKDSDIRSLDMERAIDDMKKDKILQQYQYFVGNARTISDYPDGSVIRKF